MEIKSHLSSLFRLLTWVLDSQINLSTWFEFPFLVFPCSSSQASSDRLTMGHLSSLPHPLSSMADYCPQPARHCLDQLKGTSALRYTDRLPQPSPLTMPHLIDDLNKPVLPSMRTLISSPLSWSPLLWILFGPHHKGIMSNDKGLERTRNIFFFYSFTVFMTMPMGTLTALGKRG